MLMIYCISNEKQTFLASYGRTLPGSKSVFFSQLSWLWYSMETTVTGTVKTDPGLLSIYSTKIHSVDLILNLCLQLHWIKSNMYNENHLECYQIDVIIAKVFSATSEFINEWYWAGMFSYEIPRNREPSTLSSSVSHSRRKELCAWLGRFPGMAWLLYLSVSASPNRAFCVDLFGSASRCTTPTGM